MQDNLIISISREYGSGGREIAETLATRLGISYYDKLLIARIAEESGFSDDVIKAYDEKPLSRLLLNPNRFLSGMDGSQPVAGEIYKSEIALIKKVAEESSCVIVGRRADSILEDEPGLIRVFVSAPLEDRIPRVMRRNDLDEKEARSRILKTDKDRASFHNHFSSKKWGAASSYDLCINSGQLDIEGSVEVILKHLQVFTDENPSIVMPSK